MAARLASCCSDLLRDDVGQHGRDDRVPSPARRRKRTDASDEHERTDEYADETFASRPPVRRQTSVTNRSKADTGRSPASTPERLDSRRTHAERRVAESGCRRSRQRHLAELTFPGGVASAAGTVVGVRGTPATARRRRGLDGAGKRAAFALFYAPLHFLLIRHVDRSAAGGQGGIPALVDLGCGTGRRAPRGRRRAACERTPPVAGSIATRGRSAEARDDLPCVRPPRAASASGDARRIDAADRWRPWSCRVHGERVGAPARSTLLAALMSHAQSGGRVLVVEPLAGFVAPWWSDWQRAFEAAGGRADEWRSEGRSPADRREARSRGRDEPPRDHRAVALRGHFVGSASADRPGPAEAGRHAPRRRPLQEPFERPRVDDAVARHAG